MNRYFCLLVTIILLLIGGCSRRRGPGPLSPEEALKSFRLNEDFRIELFAAEPHVLDPVEVVFDEQGRAFAAEMLDLPDDPPSGKPPRGCIHLLEDTDGDGRAERATVFADKLLQVTSMLPWKGGLLVAAAPDILYLKDLNGDGKADERKVLFTGFALVNPESRITNLRFGIDNWIYASNNGQRGTITFSERPDLPPVNVLGADFRFRLDRGLFEAESGPTQFGQAMDDWGHRFITENTLHVRHVVTPRRYYDRNPLLAAGAAAQDISDHGQPAVPIFPLTKPQYWREVRTQMRQQRYRENKLEDVRPLSASTEIVGGYFSAAAGGTIYSGDAFPEKYRGNLFTGDVSANLVHRDILDPDGVSFVAKRPPEEQDREFLASTDPWFRPCNFATGPDGNLYVVDMYREFIETPESIPEELKKDMDFYSGDTMGRIYRIVPRDAPKSKAVRPDLGKAGTSDLVRLLSHRNGWWRLTAQRLLLERQDKSAVPLLTKMVLEGESPQARLHALYALEGLSALDSALVDAGLRDSNPGVREHAVRLAESFPELLPKLASLAGDSSPHVRFHLALSLGQFLSPLRPEAATETSGASRARPDAKGDLVIGTLAALASGHAQDRWFRAAILSSTPQSSARLLQSIVSRGDFFGQPTAGKEEFLRDLASVVGTRHDTAEILHFMNLLLKTKQLGAEPWQVAGLSGLARGLKVAEARLKVASVEALLASSLAGPSEKVQAAARSVARHFEMPAFISRSIREALNPSLPVERREIAIQSLGGGRFPEVRPVLERLLSAELDQKLLKAAVAALASFDDPEISRVLIGRWKSFGPEIRNDVLDALLGHKERAPALLEAIEGGRIERAALDLPRKEKLLRNPDEKVSGRAGKIFGGEAGDRDAVVQAYHTSLNAAGDATRGKSVFEKNCATCHTARGGRRIGPDLSGVNSRTKAQLLNDILAPSQSIQPAYTNYVIVTRDGRIHDGLIANESRGTITLRRSDSDDETILRSNIGEIRASPVSLMPDGLEAGMSKGDMADLIAYLQATHLRPGNSGSPQGREAARKDN
jgi:putative membrane-bound dehydrogenase-like protein